MDDEASACVRTLIPFDIRETIGLNVAARMAGRTERTIRNWCEQFGIGRKMPGGTWAVSKVALVMLIEGDRRTLGFYQDGARRSHERVAGYYHRLGLGELLERPDIAA